MSLSKAFEESRDGGGFGIYSRSAMGNAKALGEYNFLKYLRLFIRFGGYSESSRLLEVIEEQEVE